MQFTVGELLIDFELSRGDLVIVVDDVFESHTVRVRLWSRVDVFVRFGPEEVALRVAIFVTVIVTVLVAVSLSVSKSGRDGVRLDALREVSVVPDAVSTVDVHFTEKVLLKVELELGVQDAEMDGEWLN